MGCTDMQMRRPAKLAETSSTMPLPVAVQVAVQADYRLGDLPLHADTTFEFEHYHTIMAEWAQGTF